MMSPSGGGSGLGFPSKQGNYIITAGSDRNVRFISLLPESKATDTKQNSKMFSIKRELKGCHISNADKIDRGYQLNLTGDDVQIV